MPKAKENKSQHYVTKCYLSAWSDPTAPSHLEPYVWMFKAESRTGKPKAPKNVFEEADFYTVTTPHGERDLVLEHGLQELEGRFADIRRHRLDKSIAPSVEEVTYLMAFMVAMSFRTKAHRAYRQEQWANVLRGMDDAVLRAAAIRPGKVPTVRWGNNPNVTLSRDEVQKLADAPIQHMMAIEIATYLPVLAGKGLLVLETDDPVGFITSDDPCIWINERENARPPLLPDIGEFGIMMPASPRQMLFVNPWNQNAFARVPADHVTDLNRQTRGHAHEYFISSRSIARDAWF